MKQLLTLCIALLGIQAVIAQKSAITVFSHDGDRFFVILDGIRQNDAPSTNVKITDLERENYVLRVIFENQNIKHIQRNILLVDVDDKRVDVVYGIKRNRKGVPELRLSSFNEAKQSPVAKNEEVVKFHTVENPLQTTQTNQSNQTVQVNAPAVNTTIKETNSGIKSEVNVLGVGVNQTITESPNGVSVNMNITGLPTDLGGISMESNDVEVTRQTQTTQTTQTTQVKSTPQPVAQVTERAAPVENRCTRAMSGSDFAKAKQSVANQSFSDSKMKTARQFTRVNCLSVKQIREIMDLFSFEGDKLTYAKFAYDFCMDKNNYFQLTEAFKFSSSSDELNDFLDTKQ